MVSGDRKAKLTQADKAAAKRLRAIWDARDRKDRLSQEEVGALFDTSQSNANQYLNAKIPLNFLAVLAFSIGVKCAPEEIRSDLPEQRLLRRLYPTLRRPDFSPESVPDGWPFPFPAEFIGSLDEKQITALQDTLEAALRMITPSGRPKRRRAG